MVERHPRQLVSFSSKACSALMVYLQSMLRFLIIVPAIIDILFKRRRPRDVINLLDRVSVRLQSSQELIETETRLSSNMNNTSGVVRGMEGSGNNNPHDVVRRASVDGVADVRARTQLDTSLPEASQEVVSHADTRFGIALFETISILISTDQSALEAYQNISGPDDASLETAGPCSAN